MYRPSDSLDIWSSAHVVSSCADECKGCNLCKKECAFLERYGNPGKIARMCESDPDKWLMASFECSLCGLCKSVCPKKLDPSAMFLDFRRKVVKNKKMNFSGYQGLLNYEKKGMSKKYSYYHLPEKCSTVFFPGCSITGTRPENTLKAYEYLQKQDKSTGIVLDCCTKPSHDIGRQDYFDKMFSEMKLFLLESGINTIIVACPNCHNIFNDYAREFKLETVYDVMARSDLPNLQSVSGQISVHDPCPVRFQKGVQQSVRSLVSSNGLSIIETPHEREKTYCCGEGGAVGCLNPEYENIWTQKIADEKSGTPVVSYCGGCVNYLSAKTQTMHVLDLVFDPQKAMDGKSRVSKAPFTYLNRLKVKRTLKKLPANIKREREYDAEPEPEKNIVAKVLITAFLIAAVAGIQTSGLHEYLDQEKLGRLIQSYGNLAPVIYMAIYTLAPSLFLPGLPITIAGGILFGPFWGVVYAIIGSTAGAGVAFLISRYVSAGFIGSRLTGPKWHKLQGNVEKHGWKVVAAARLIPILPFNLLNYAFGLTQIKFSHYLVATFAGMLPACIAFIVFSSSLLDLLKGELSLEFLIGGILIVIVGLIPFATNVYKKKVNKKLGRV